MSVSKVNVNGVELEINLLDADVIERFEQLNKDISKKIQDPKAYEGKTTAEGMKFQCRCVEEYFDSLFGLGTSNRVFPKNNDLGIRMDAFAQVTALSGTIKTQINNRLNFFCIELSSSNRQRSAHSSVKAYVLPQTVGGKLAMSRERHAITLAGDM